MKEVISRYRREKDEDAMAGSLDTAEDTQGSVASTRQCSNQLDTNWSSSAASLAGNITIDYSRKATTGVTPIL